MQLRLSKVGTLLNNADKHCCMPWFLLESLDHNRALHHNRLQVNHVNRFNEPFTQNDNFSPPFSCDTEISKIGAFTLLTSRFLKSRHFDPTIYTCAKNHDFLVGSAHVRSQATVHAFMHAVCMRAEDIDTRFKERA